MNTMELYLGSLNLFETLVFQSISRRHQLGILVVSLIHKLFWTVKLGFLFKYFLADLIFYHLFRKIC